MPALILTPTQKKTIGIGLAAVVGFSAWNAGFWSPQRRTLAKTRSQIQKLRLDIAGVRKRLDRLPQMEEQVGRWSNKQELTASAMSPEEQVPDLLDKIVQAARTAHVRLQTAKPAVDFREAAPGLSGFLELPVVVEASAGYHEIGLFFDALERSESLIRVQGLEIRSDPTDLWHHQTTVLLLMYLSPGSSNKR